MKLDFSALTFIPSAIMFDLSQAMLSCNIDTPLRAAHFLSQAKEESDNFTRTEENLNYSADGLMKVFSKHFSSTEMAVHYARNPEMIANRVYANRYGNGDEPSGDGWKFRGRGYFQLTFHDNYQAFSDFVNNEDLTESPDLVKTKYSAMSAAWFFKKNGLNAIADQGGEDSTKVVQEITKIINEGLAGLTVRQSNFNLIFPLIKIVQDA